MKVLGVNPRDLVIALVLGRVLKKKTTSVSTVVLGTNLGLGIAALYWLAKRRPPERLPVASRVQVYGLLPEQAARR